MGFLNPFLYKNADAFFDVVLGTNAIGRGTGPIEYGQTNISCTFYEVPHRMHIVVYSTCTVDTDTDFSM